MESTELHGRTLESLDTWRPQGRDGSDQMGQTKKAAEPGERPMKQSGADRDSPTRQAERRQTATGTGPGAARPWLLSRGPSPHRHPPGLLISYKWESLEAHTVPPSPKVDTAKQQVFLLVSESFSAQRRRQPRPGTAASPALETHPPSWAETQSWAGWGSGKPNPPLPSWGFRNAPCPFSSWGLTLTQPPRALGETGFGTTPVHALRFYPPPTLG